MTIYITEHQGHPLSQLPNNRPLAAYALSSAAAVSLSAGADYVRATADGGSYLGLYGSTTVALTSTNAFRIPANAPGELFPVSTSFKIQAAST